jgi:transposase-like protein
VKCPRCLSSYITPKKSTIFERLAKFFQAPPTEGRDLLRYRCTACHFVFTARDRRLLSRKKRD